jgi:hypothetical protein
MDDGISADFAHVLVGEGVAPGHDLRFGTALLGKDIQIERHVVVGCEVPHSALPLEAARLRGNMIGATALRRAKDVCPPLDTRGAAVIKVNTNYGYFFYRLKSIC